MARRPFVRGQRTTRKHTDWSASAVLTGGVVVAATASALLEVFTPAAGGETLIRTRGMLGIQSDQSGALEDQLVAFGIGVVSAQAVSVGITAIPHPGTDAAWGGWLYHTFLFATYLFISGVGSEPQFMTSHVIDSKAMRKTGDEERLVMVVENTHASHGFRFANSERLLSKVH